MASTSADVLDDTSGRLAARAARGDPRALGRLVCRYLPQLHRWAHGRLPRWARTLADTPDLIQDAALHTIRRFGTFELRGEQALGAYLRQAVRNRVRDEHRRLARRGTHQVLSDHQPAAEPSPLDRVITSERERRYRAALARLHPADRELIVAHVELGYTHEQIGCMTGRSRNAARMALHRAVHRLADAMDDA